MRDVRLVLRQGAVILVDWIDDDDAPHRSIVPKEYVTVLVGGMGLADDDTLVAGIQPGIDWAALMGDASVSATDIANALKRAGFWTHIDIERKPVEAQKIIDKTVGVRAATLARLAKKMEV